jgi:hypothetical protein
MIWLFTVNLGFSFQQHILLWNVTWLLVWNDQMVWVTSPWRNKMNHISFAKHILYFLQGQNEFLLKAKKVLNFSWTIPATHQYSLNFSMISFWMGWDVFSLRTKTDKGEREREREREREWIDHGKITPCYDFSRGK